MEADGFGCSLTEGQMRGRSSEWEALASGALQAVERVSGALVLRFRSDEHVESELRRLAELESQCCSGLRFWVVASGGSVDMHVEGPWEQTPWKAVVGQF